MAPVHRWIDRFEKRLLWGRFLQRAAESLAVALFVFGTAVLIVRLWIPHAWPYVLWLAVGVMPAAALAWYQARRSRDARSRAVAMLDQALDTGGLLMTLTEQPDPQWAERLPQAEIVWREALPRIRPRRFASYLALPLLFAVASCFVPLREASSTPILRNSVGQQATEQLEELLTALDEVLPEEEKKELEKEIEKLAEETRQTPLTHEKWETIDALRERMTARVEAATAEASKFSDAVAQLAKAGDENLPLSEENLLRLEKDAVDALQQLMKKGAFDSAPQSLKDQLQRLSQKKRLPSDPAEREKLLDELREHLDQEERKLSELRKKCEGCKSLCKGQCEGEGECEGQCEGKKSGSRDGDGRPGRGGVNRGRGDAELTWGDESDKDGTKFKETVLPPGMRDQPKEETVGLSKTAPNEEPAANAARGAARDIDPASGQTTWNRPLSPKHRNVVRKFFDKP